MLHKTTLFEARTGGYHNYRVPGILTTPRGVVLATVEARRGRGGDWDGNDVLWYPDCKFFLLGKRITADLLAGLTVPAS